MSLSEQRLEEIAPGAGEREAQVQASLAARMLAWIEPILAKEEESIQKRAFGILNNGDELDPTLAVQLWAQLWAAQRLRANLNRIVRLGEQAAKRGPLTI